MSATDWPHLLADITAKRDALNQVIEVLTRHFIRETPAPIAEASTPHRRRVRRVHARPTRKARRARKMTRTPIDVVAASAPTPLPPAVGERPVQRRQKNAPDRPVAAAATPPPATSTRPLDPEQTRRDVILRYLTTAPKSTKEIAAHLGEDRLIVKMALQRMRKVQLLVKVGVTNGQRWALPIASAVTQTAAPPAKTKASTPLQKPTAEAKKAPPRDPVEVVDARDKAVLRFLERHDGVASQKELLAAIPTDDPAATPDAKAEALTQSLHRLKFKQRIGRTGDTWSLVGAGMTVAHG